MILDLLEYNSDITHSLCVSGHAFYMYTLLKQQTVTRKNEGVMNILKDVLSAGKNWLKTIMSLLMCYLILVSI